MKYYQKFFGHLWMILRHKAWVFYYSCKIGIPLRGLVHDLSKFSPTEFFESVRYYTGTSSPINACKADKGYSLAWQHHKGRNSHHYEYWLDRFDEGVVPILIPFKYITEMTADWLAAGKAYHGKDFNFKDEYEWWKVKRKQVQKSMHPVIIAFFDRAFKFMYLSDEVPNKNLLKAMYNVEKENFEAKQEGVRDGIASVKSTDWSDEDEEMRKHIISDLRGFMNFETDEELVSDYEDEISWLKSLKPRKKEDLPMWKPSEEQMGALQAVINEPNNASSLTCQLGLQDLLNCLEHLKGFAGKRRENGKGDSPDAPKIVSEGLEEAAENYPSAIYVVSPQWSGEVRAAFKAGAEWQKEQMLKDAVEYKIVNNLAAYPVIYYEVNHLGLKYGDKVKVIVIKEDGK